MVFSGVLMSGATIARHVEIAREAERLGYESAWVTEVAGPDAVTVMAAAAGATSRIKIATGIVPIFARDPYLMAMTFHSLQDLSDGRMVAGFGTSTPAIITGWHGLPFGRPLAKTRAYVGLLRQLLAGERVKSEGEFTLRGAALRGAVKTPVPIYLAALNDGMLELAGEVADGVILNFPTMGYAERALATIGRGLAKAGRTRESIDIVANFRTGIGEFDAIAGPLRRELITYYLAPVYQKVFRADGYGSSLENVTGLWAAGDRAEAVTSIPDMFVDDHAVIGTAEECAAKVTRFLELGIDRAVLFPVVADGPGAGERYLETMRAFV